MSASVEYYLELQYNGHSTTTAVYDPGETGSGIELELDQPLESGTRMNAVLRTADGDEPVISHQFEYDLAPPDATLVVDAQQAAGEQFVVEELIAETPYYLVVDYGAGRVETEPFEPEQPITNLVVELDPPIRRDRTVELSLRTTDDRWELATETVAYTFEPTATLQVSDQTGDGHTLDVTAASANVEYRLVATYDGTVVGTDTFAADTEVAPELDLDPRIVEETSVEVGVRTVDGTPIRTDQVTFTPTPPAGPELTAERARSIVEDTFPFVGTPDVFEEWLDGEVEPHPDGYRVRLDYLAARQRAVFSSDAERTETATAEFAIDAFEALFTSEYRILDVEVGVWLTVEGGEIEQAGETRLDRDAAAGVDWDDLRDEPTDAVPAVAEPYEFEYFE